MGIGLFRRFFEARQGGILVETAVTLSVLAVLSLAGMEVARYTLLHQKMERIAASIGDLIAQGDTTTLGDLTQGDVDNIFSAITEVAKPFAMGANGIVIISSVGATGGPPTMYWQRSGGGSHPGTSQVGTEGGAATLPAGLTVAAGETVIVAEVHYSYKPWIYAALIGDTELYHTAFFRPRLGSLTTPPT